ncbi:MAG: adenine deaminase, partial [Firmicutes bacterium]|nr:adenine deaminase [Bacillota bacterium]
EVIRADVAIVDGWIAGIGTYSADNEKDCTGLTVCPGLIDAHCHIESSMAVPAEFSRAVLPSGTTTLIADPHEIVNVCGAQGLRFMLDAAADSVCDIFYMLPSCVPATPFETSGARFDAEDMLPFLSHPRVLGLAEVMNFPGVLSADPAMLAKMKLFEQKMIDGHAPGATGNALQAYAAAGVRSDHEATTYTEAAEKARAGMAVLVRQGSAAHDLQAILAGVRKEKLSTRRFMFCTDDKHLDDIRREGHILQNVRMAIELGFDPVEAITMASYNAAEHYSLRDRGAVAPGRRADLLLISDLTTMRVESVYKDGRPASELLVRPSAPPDVPETVRRSVHLKTISADDIRLNVSGITDVIGMLPGQLLTHHLREAVPAENGFFV